LLDLALGWAVIQLVGIICFPLAWALFPPLKDRGYAFSKALGLLFVSYLLWVGGSLHLVPFSRLSILVVLLLVGLLSAWVAARRWGELVAFFRQRWAYVLLVECLFVAVFLGEAYLRALNPALNSGEKLGDFGFLNSVLRARYFPLEDFWLAGQPVNYYYFGYVMWGMVIKLTGAHPEVGCNAALALLAGLSALGAFGVLYNLKAAGKPRTAVIWGLVGVGFLLLLANIEGVLEAIYARGWGSTGFWSWIGIEGLGHPYQSATWYPTENAWWWRATRVIGTYQGGQALDYTITEFPFFSFYFGDLHPHLMALPFALLNLGLLANMFFSQRPWSLSLSLLPALLVMALSLGALGFLNTWDFLVYFFLFLMVLSIHTYALKGRVRGALFVAALVLALALLLYLPFYWGLTNPLQGVWPWLGPGTTPLAFIIVWGLFIFISLGFLLRQARGLRWREGLMAWGVVLFPGVLWALVALVMGKSGLLVGRLPLIVGLSLLLAVALGSLVRRAEEGWREEALALILVFTGFLILMGVELFYLRDHMGNRQNTVFKFSFQAWVLLALGSAYGLSRLVSLRSWGWWVWRGCLALLLTGALFYPVAAIATLRSGSEALSLDGMAFVEKALPGEREAIEWLRGRPGVVLEAVGDDYSLAGRVSAMSGMPTVVGQVGHEIGWRGVGPWVERSGDVDRMYLNPGDPDVRELLKTYNVKYIYVGALEKARYGPLEELEKIFPVAFRNEQVVIYQVDGGVPGAEQLR
jgi:YYY domain-containing protein